MCITIRKSLSSLETTQNHMHAENEHAQACTTWNQTTYAMVVTQGLKFHSLAKNNPWLESYLYNKNS